MANAILTHRLANGMALVAEPMPWLESVAFALLAPAGCARDPDDRLGLANLACEMAERGCGSRDSRQFVEDLEYLGVDSTSGVANTHVSFAAAMPADSLGEALAIHADLARRPHLPADQLEDARQSCLQEVWAVDDDLAQKCMVELRRRSYPDPFGRTNFGAEETLEACTLDDVRNFIAAHYQPAGAILAVAGKFDWNDVRARVDKLFGDWAPRPAAPVRARPAPTGWTHIPHDSPQTQIGVSFPSVSYRDPDYYKARAAVGVLSDGFASRLFSEAREKRGLSYSVYAQLHSLRDRGAVFSYIGPDRERAQEALEVMLGEFTRLGQGVRADELERLKAQLKSGTIMQQESSRSRASSIASDWYFLERVRSLPETLRIIEELRLEDINRHLAERPPRDFMVVTLGSEPLEVPRGISPPHPG